MTINNNNILLSFPCNVFMLLQHENLHTNTKLYDNIIPIALRGNHLFESFYYSLLHLLGFKLAKLLTYITEK